MRSCGPPCRNAARVCAHCSVQSVLTPPFKPEEEAGSSAAGGRMTRPCIVSHARTLYHHNSGHTCAHAACTRFLCSTELGGAPTVLVRLTPTCRRAVGSCQQDSESRQCTPTNVPGSDDRGRTHGATQSELPILDRLERHRGPDRHVVLWSRKV